MKKIYIILLAAFSLLWAACDKDSVTDSTGYTEADGESLVTVFHLSVETLNIGSTPGEVQFVVVNPSTHTTRTFEGTISYNASMRVLNRDGAAICRMKLGDESIPDGTYIVMVSGDLIPELGIRKVTFKGNVGTEELRATYDLEGSGTADDPYLITSDGDFQSFIWGLLDDDTNAYGLSFKQTESFDVPSRSMIIDGNVWAPASFSGIYDGGGNELRSLTYMGSSNLETDCYIGLFSRIFDATLRNVVIKSGMLLNTHSSIGMLAGLAQGNCTLENITVNGTVTACGNNIGGLVGESDGSLTIRRVTVNSLAVNAGEMGSQNVGLIVGAVRNGDFTIEQVYTPDHVFTVTGKRNVGALAGGIDNCGEINVKNVTVEHSVDDESKGVKVVYASEFGAGIVAGHIGSYSTLNLEKVSVKAPVRSSSDTGGFVGNADKLKSVNVNGVTLTSVVNGENSTGGFFGYLGFDSNGTLNFTGAQSRYVLKSSAAAEVSGAAHTGALIGYLEGGSCKINFSAPMEIAVNVSGTDEVGGAVGFAKNIGEMRLENLNFSSTTMRVTASGRYCGGVIGRAERVTLCGGNDNIKPVDKIPSDADLKPCFSGVVTAQDDAAGVIGHVTGANIIGCFSRATVTAGTGNAGGIAGYVEGNVSSCAFAGSASGKGSVGGIVASLGPASNIRDCANLKGFDGGGAANLGGIFGYFFAHPNDNIYIERNYNGGDLRGGQNLGGIGGMTNYDRGTGDEWDHLYIYQCGNAGNLTATGDSSKGVGGIIGVCGFFITEIKGCSNSGDIHATTVMYSVGGIVGAMGRDNRQGSFYVRQCRNTGKVTCSDFYTKIGGVVGSLQPPMGSSDWMESKIQDCLNLGPLPGDQQSDTGGILGFASHHTHIDRCFNGGRISYGNSIVGTHSAGSKFYHSDNYYKEGSGNSWPDAHSVSAADLGNKSTYHNFDFNQVWDITSDGPRLRHCPF